MSTAFEGASTESKAGGKEAEGKSGSKDDACQYKEPKDWVDCDLDKMMELNSIGSQWSKDRKNIKSRYGGELKGETVKVWWPGRGHGGKDCDNVDLDRGCWYSSKLLTDPDCGVKGRCLHYAMHTGEPTDTFTCPTWIFREDGKRCKLPQVPGCLWQACPMKFNKKRVDSGIPQAFGEAMRKPCEGGRKPIEKAPEFQLDAKHQLKTDPKTSGPGGVEPANQAQAEEKTDPGGSAEEDDTADAQEERPVNDGAGTVDVDSTVSPDSFCKGGPLTETPVMVIDLKKNSWARCNCKLESASASSSTHDSASHENMDMELICRKNMHCEDINIRRIDTTPKPQCGDKTCGSGEQCFVHLDDTGKEAYQCVKDQHVWLVTAGDDMARSEAAIDSSLVLLLPEGFSCRRRSRRDQQLHAFF